MLRGMPTVQTMPTVQDMLMPQDMPSTGPEQSLPWKRRAKSTWQVKIMQRRARRGSWTGELIFLTFCWLIFPFQFFVDHIFPDPVVTLYAHSVQRNRQAPKRATLQVVLFGAFYVPQSKRATLQVVWELLLFCLELFTYPCIIIDPHQSVTFVRIATQTNIRIYLYQKNYTNKYPNIFVSKIWQERMSE